MLHTLLSLLKGAGALPSGRDNGDRAYVAVAFDPLPAVRGPSTSDPGTLIRRQSALALDAVRALGIPLWPMVRFQADDALATGARVLFGDRAVDEVVLCTTDTDLFQCIRGERVVVLDRIRDVVTNEDAFRARYGIAPRQLPDYLALVGAPAKGLPGVPRWGPKSAAAMLAAYPGIEDFPTDVRNWRPAMAGKSRLASELAARRDEATLVERLATLHDDLPIDCSLSTLEWRGLDDERLGRVVARVEADDLWPRIGRWRG